MVIPLYGRGGDNTDPREKVPPRPRGQRTEAPQQGFPGFQWGDGGPGGGVQFSLGIGYFKQGFPGFQWGDGGPGGGVQFSLGIGRFCFGHIVMSIIFL
ncbi:unnamed protein product [Strongylus vulgaris]|uniref:Uncharacterized protein n=1 Tax=Strongylus vulgaris TaxID=40348 RepID=A0A3P7JBJ6_STRVU|nr:unnamed protein product [Strongylus vulgaris]